MEPAASTCILFETATVRGSRECAQGTWGGPAKAQDGNRDNVSVVGG